MRLLHTADLEDLAVGAAVLGAGGGGDPYSSKLMALQAVAAHGPVALLDCDELGDDDLVVPLAMVGAPTVLVEKPFAHDTFLGAFQMLARHLGRPVRATMPFEIGGLNALTPIPVAARLGLPLVDADGMGRAFPELQMTTLTLHGLSGAPLVVADDRGNRTIITAVDNHWLERLARSHVIDMGGVAAAALYPLTGRDVRAAGIPRSLSRAIQIGRVVRTARAAEHSPLEAVRQVLRGTSIFEGKIVDVQRQSCSGFARGEVMVEGLGQYQGSRLVVQFQNEYLVASVDGALRVTTPDLIGVFDARTGAPIAVEGLRYGYQVVVLGIPSTPLWRTPAGLALVGPRAFGYAVDYIPFGTETASEAPS